MGHPELFSRACHIRRRAAESNINKARLNNSDVPFYRVEYMFYHTYSVPCFNFIIIIFSVVSFYSLSCVFLFSKTKAFETLILFYCFVPSFRVFLFFDIKKSIKIRNRIRGRVKQ